MIVRETDEAFIREVSLHPSIWRHVSNTETPQDFELPDGIYYTLVNHGIKAGFMVFLPEDGFTSVHIAVLPKHRGRWIVDDARQAIKEVGGKLKVRVRHMKAYALAYRCGFRKTGMDADEWIDMELR